MKRYLPILAAVLLLGAGCASPATPPTNAPRAAADPASQCDALMTLAEAQRISGLAYAQRDVSGVTNGPIVVTTCTYSSNDRTTGVKPLSVVTRRATSIEEANKIFDESKTVSYADGREIPGLGDRALWSPTFGQLSVLRGQTWLIVTATNNQVLATKIAEALVPKLR